MLGLVGATSIDSRIADVTVSVVRPDTAPIVAVMVAEPGLTDVARPLEPVALLTTTAAAFDELHVADAVRSWVLLSE